MRTGIAMKAVVRGRLRIKRRSIPQVKMKNNSGSPKVGLFHDRFFITASFAAPNLYKKFNGMESGIVKNLESQPSAKERSVTAANTAMPMSTKTPASARCTSLEISGAGGDCGIPQIQNSVPLCVTMDEMQRQRQPDSSADNVFMTFVGHHESAHLNANPPTNAESLE
jgi:hypothetical protein